MIIGTNAFINVEEMGFSQESFGSLTMNNDVILLTVWYLHHISKGEAREQFFLYHLFYIILLLQSNNYHILAHSILLLLVTQTGG